MSRDAVIVSTARTPIGRAYKGGFNATHGATLGAASFAPAVERAGIDAGEIDDVVWGAVHAGWQHRSSGRAARWCASNGRGSDHRPSMFFGPDGDFYGC